MNNFEYDPSLVPKGIHLRASQFRFSRDGEFYPTVHLYSDGQKSPIFSTETQEGQAIVSWQPNQPHEAVLEILSEVASSDIAPEDLLFSTLNKIVSRTELEAQFATWNDERYTAGFSFGVSTPTYTLFAERFSTDPYYVGVNTTSLSGIAAARRLFETTATPEIKPHEEKLFELVKPAIDYALSD